MRTSRLAPNGTGMSNARSVEVRRRRSRASQATAIRRGSGRARGGRAGPRARGARGRRSRRAPRGRGVRDRPWRRAQDGRPSGERSRRRSPRRRTPPRRARSPECSQGGRSSRNGSTATPQKRPTAFTTWSSRMVPRIVARGSRVARASHSARASSPARAGTTSDTAKPITIAWNDSARVTSGATGVSSERQRPAIAYTAARYTAAAAVTQAGCARPIRSTRLSQCTSWNAHAPAAPRTPSPAARRAQGVRSAVATGGGCDSVRCSVLRDLDHAGDGVRHRGEPLAHPSGDRRPLVEREGAALGGGLVGARDDPRDVERLVERPPVGVTPAHAVEEVGEERRVPLRVGGIAAHAVIEGDLLGGGGAHDDTLVVAHQLARIPDELEADRAAPGRPRQAHLGQAVAEVQHHECRVLDRVRRVAEVAHRGVHRRRLAEHRAQLVEDMRAVVEEDTPAGERGVGAPRRRPVRVAGVRLRAQDLVLDEMDASDAGEEPGHRLPLRRVVVLVARDEHRACAADRGGDRLRFGEARRDRLLAQDVDAARGRRLDERAVAERWRADVAEVELFAGEQLLGALVEAHPGEGRRGRRAVLRGEVGRRHDPRRAREAGGARPLGDVPPQGDVPRAQKGAPQRHFHAPEAASSSKVSSRMARAFAAVPSSIVRDGFTRKEGL